jgi:hypothetical protein
VSSERFCYKCGINPREHRCSYCRDCRNTEQRKYVSRDPEKVRAAQKLARLNNIDKYKAREHATARTVEGRYRLAKSSAKKRGLEFSLSFEEYDSLVKGNACHYCDGKLPETGVGIDRKDSAVGYHFTNLVPCCFTCNTMKNAFLTYEEMLLVWNYRRNKNGKAIGASSGV